MSRIRAFGLACFAALFWLNASLGQAQMIRLSLPEIAQRADLIFVGTVAAQTSRFNQRKTMIETEVAFTQIELVHASERAVQRKSATITLSYAGGRVGDYSVEVSDTPRFETGKRYLLFALDNGESYLTPIVGGAQGLFEVVRDTGTGREFALTASGKAIVGLGANGFTTSSRRIAQIKGGRLIALPEQAAESATQFNLPPQSSAEHPAESRRSEAQRAGQSEAPLPLPAVIEFILNDALKQQLPDKPNNLRNQTLPKPGTGGLVRQVGDEWVIEALPRSEFTVPTIPERFQRHANSASQAGQRNSPNVPNAVAGGPVGYCGYHKLPIVMEQISPASNYFQINEDTMFVWNLFMDLFRVKDDDGTFNGSNGQNEFVGFLTNAEYNSAYSKSFGNAIAVTISFFSGDPCTQIHESDVIWNGDLLWTNNVNLALANGNIYLMRPTNMHEVGHVWGAQRGPWAETYDYDVPTVMQGYNSDIVVDDGQGIHAVDAFMIRRDYLVDIPIPNFRDVGVESYYPGNGLNPSTTDAASYNPGKLITLQNVMVENMSQTAVNNLRIRFYLSSDRNLSGNDYELISNTPFVWPSFPGENWNVSNYTLKISDNAAPGNYYVLAAVSFDGADGFAGNNVTSFYSTINLNCTGAYTINGVDLLGLPATGGRGSLTINAPGSCGWAAASDAAWLKFDTSSGAGNGTVKFFAPAFVATGSPQTRTGKITLQGREFTVIQTSAPECKATTPISFNEPVEDELNSSSCLSAFRTIEGQFRPFAQAYGFAVRAAGQQVWITLSARQTGPFINKLDPYLIFTRETSFVFLQAPLATDDDSGTGNAARIPATGVFTLPAAGGYRIEATSADVENPIGKYTLTLHTCTASLEASKTKFSASGGTGTFTVSTQTGCQWTAESDVSWIKLSSQVRGFGLGDAGMGFTVGVNTTGKPRTGKILAGGAALIIEQSAGLR